MAFGLEDDAGGGSSGEFLDRINLDARTGFWVVTRREQMNGEWTNIKGQPQPTASFLFDIGSFEIGWVKIASPPSFILVPWGSPNVPRKPEEMTTFVNDKGETKSKSAYSAGFRVKVMSKVTFGNDQPHYFSGNSKTLNTPVDELIRAAMAAPQAAQGLIPFVRAEKTRPVQITTPKGTNTFYAPIFEVVSWHPRPETFGTRVVPAPAGGAAPAPQHAPTPAPAVVNQMPPPAQRAAAPAMAGADDVPFAPEVR